METKASVWQISKRKRKNVKKYFSNFRHPFVFLLTELSSQLWKRRHIHPEIPNILADDLYIGNRAVDRGWRPVRGLTTVGVENGTIIGEIVGGRLAPICNDYDRVINIGLLGLRRIELSEEEVRRLPFGQKFRRTMIVNFVIHPNAHN